MQIYLYIYIYKYIHIYIYIIFIRIYIYIHTHMSQDMHTKIPPHDLIILWQATCTHLLAHKQMYKIYKCTRISILYQKGLGWKADINSVKTVLYAVKGKCTHTYTRVHTHTLLFYAYKREYTHTHKYTYINTHMFIYTHSHKYTLCMHM